MSKEPSTMTREELIKQAKGYCREKKGPWSVLTEQDLANFAEQHAATIIREPVDMLLYCPVCFEQHVDEAKPDVCEVCGAIALTGTCPCFKPWLNPPHKSHRCNFCNHVWRPADRPTNGVQSLQSKGERDGSARPIAFANGKDFNDAVAIASGKDKP